MLEDAAGIRRVVLACGTVDLRKGIDGLATIIGDKYGQNPFEKGTLFLFCGKCSDRCKGLLWMGTGFLLLYKRFEDGRLFWPRTTQEAADLTEEQYRSYIRRGSTRRALIFWDGTYENLKGRFYMAIEKSQKESDGKG